MIKDFLAKNSKFITAMLGILIILLFRNKINEFWLEVVGIPLLGNIQSSIFNDCTCMLLITLGVISIAIRKTLKKKQKITTEEGLFIVSFYVLYCYQRILFPDTFVPFYLCPHIAYADILPILLFISILKFKIGKESEVIVPSDILTPYIINYLNDNSDQYAIMLSGEYGTGKTFYYEHTVKNLIKSSNKEPIYISAYGIKSHDDLHKKLIEEVHPIIKGSFFHLFSSILNALSSFFGGNINLNKTGIAKSLDVDWKNYVICIDDLERIAHTDCITEFFGYLNDLLIKYKVKILFIANEEKLNDDNKIPDYKRNKEKLIRFTYQYTCEIKCFIETYINNEGKTQFSEYLDSVKERIVHFYSHQKQKNLRTLQFNLSILKQIYSLLQKNHEKELLYKLLNKKYLFLTMIYSVEYKEKNNLDIFHTIDIEKTNILLHRKYYGGLLPNTNSDGTQIELTTEASIVDKYWGLHYHLYDDSQFLMHYITTGFLKHDEFEREIKRLEEDIQIKEKTRKKSLLANLENLWGHEDAEMQVNVEDALLKLEKGEIGVNDYPAFIHALSIIDENGFANVGIQEDSVQNRIRQGLSIRMRIEQSCINEDIEYNYHPCLQLKQEDFFKEIEDVVFDFSEKNKERKIKDRFHTNLNMAISQEISLEEYKQYDCNLFLDRITADDFLDVIINCNNKTKLEITNFIRYRFNNKKEFDAIFYKQLAESVKTYLEKNKSPRISWKIIELLSKILEGRIT